MTRDFLTFRLGSDTFALPVSQVREIIDGSGEIDESPAIPAFPGRVHRHGSEYAVYNLSLRLAKEQSSPDIRASGNALILADTGGTDSHRYIAFLVDDVIEVISVELRSISDIPDIDGGDIQTPCRRVIEYSDELIVAVDAAEVVTSAERVALSAAAVTE